MHEKIYKSHVFESNYQTRSGYQDTKLIYQMARISRTPLDYSSNACQLEWYSPSTIKNEDLLVTQPCPSKEGLKNAGDAKLAK